MVFGAGGGDQQPANQFSKDSYATGHNVIPKSIFGGKVIRRPGLSKKRAK